MSVDIETDRGENGRTLDFALLDPTERAVAAALFEASASLGTDCAGDPWGAYTETPDGMQWLAGDASALVAAWRDEPTRAALEAAAEDTALADPSNPDFGRLHIDAALKVLDPEEAS